MTNRLLAYSGQRIAFSADIENIVAHVFPPKPNCFLTITNSQSVAEV